MYMPAVHHDKNKLACVRFWHRGQMVVKRDMRFADRAAALAHVKAGYPGATQISVVFYVKAEVV